MICMHLFFGPKAVCLFFEPYCGVPPAATAIKAKALPSFIIADLNNPGAHPAAFCLHYQFKTG